MIDFSEKWQQILGVPGSLRRRTLAGGNWMLLRSAAVAGADVIRAAIFARILFPEDYGLMALATMVIGFLESFSATGIELMILRDRNEPERLLPVYWTIMMTRGLFLTVFGCLLALPIAHFYGRPDLIPIICVLSLTVTLRWMGGFGRELRQRKMDFRSVAVADTIAAVGELVVATLMLLLLRSVWALVIYALVHAVALALCNYLLYPWKPNFRFDKTIFRSVLVFSSSVIGINAFNYFFTHFDVAVVGRILDMEQLGLYARASFLGLLPVIYLANTLAPVFLPAMGSLRDDPKRRKATFKKMLFSHVLFYGLIGMSMVLFSKWIVILVYGERWLGALGPFRILIAYGVSKAIASVSSTVLFALDRPWTVAASSGVMAGLFAILCIPFTRTWGIQGTASAVLVSGFLSHLAALLMAAIFIRRGCAETSGEDGWHDKS